MYAQRSLRFLILFGALIAILTPSGCGQEKKPGEQKPQSEPKVPIQSGAKEPEKESQKATAPDYVMTAEEFSAEFSADKDKATKKFTGKIVELSGVVSDLLIYGSGGAANCSFSASKVRAHASLEFLPVMQQLSLQQKIKVKGKFEHTVFLEVVNCSVNEITKSEMMRLTAPEVVKDFVDDPVKAAAKYKAAKGGIITGVVSGKTKNRIGLKGEGKRDLWVEKLDYSGSDELLDHLQIGETIRVRWDDQKTEMVGPPRIAESEIVVRAWYLKGK